MLWKFYLRLPFSSISLCSSFFSAARDCLASPGAYCLSPTGTGDAEMVNELSREDLREEDKEEKLAAELVQ